MKSKFDAAAARGLAALALGRQVYEFNCYFCRRYSGDHTEANGWPDHQRRNGAAYPFVNGEIMLDTPDAELSPQELAGRDLFRTACANCHEGRQSEAHAEIVAVGLGDENLLMVVQAVEPFGVLRVRKHHHWHAGTAARRVR